ncbi:hypothetical protein ABZX39_33535 [Streptomyces collinus]|uniref:hypothetical protein n=1 Tax=Streptomyces collinus TaxID=42684 RepID=UPI0033B65550
MASIAESFGMSREALSKDFTRAYRAAIEEERAEADVWRRFQTDRCEQLLAAVWDDAMTGDVRANEQARKLIGDINELNGWKAPVRTEVTGAEGGPLAVSTADPDKLAALIAATSRLNSDRPANTATSTPDEDPE